MGDERETRSLLQSGGAGAVRFRVARQEKCLEMGRLILRGVVKSEGGFIAVVTNSLNKAYFLRGERSGVQRVRSENYRRHGGIPGKQCRTSWGKALTREVTKKISRRRFSVGNGAPGSRNINKIEFQ